MQYGGITLDHVLAFQLRIMMGNQYGKLVEAAKNKNKNDDILVACLRLGWNDAFRHVSTNIPEEAIISSCKSRGWDDLLKVRKSGKVTVKDMDAVIVRICRSLCREFREYASLRSTEERHAYIRGKLACADFVRKFAVIKVTDPKDSDKALCFGHIQKMFNMAVKLYLCLKICAEEQARHGLQIVLEFGATPAQNVILDPALFDLFNGTDVSADCPIDHYILEAIDQGIRAAGSSHVPVMPRSRDAQFKKFDSIVWSKLNGGNDADYLDIQEEIAALQDGSGKSNLCFDFEHWNT